MPIATSRALSKALPKAEPSILETLVIAVLSPGPSLPLAYFDMFWFEIAMVNSRVRLRASGSYCFSQLLRPCWMTAKCSMSTALR